MIGTSISPPLNNESHCPAADDSKTIMSKSIEMTSKIRSRPLSYSFTGLDTLYERKTEQNIAGLEGVQVNRLSLLSTPKSNGLIQECPEISLNEPLSQILAPSTSPSSRPPSKLASYQAPSSCSDNEESNSPIDGDNSSQSQVSIQAIDSAVEIPDHGGTLHTLQGVLSSVLKTDPAVARLMLEQLKGQLEWAPSNFALDINSSLSVLSLSNMEETDSLHHNRKLTCLSSSDSDSTSSLTNRSGGMNMSLSSSGDSGIDSGSMGSKDARTGFPDGRSLGQSTRESRMQSRSQISTSNSKAHSLRCFHNVLQPAVFCTNHQTREKYRTCAGPGWDIAHLK